MGRFKPMHQPTQWRQHAAVLPALRTWLYHEGSLTTALRIACNGRLCVTVLAQMRVRPLAQERVALGLRHHEWAFVRMVYLSCAGEPWVFARTVIPGRTLSGPRRRLTHLGTRPLGEVLFADPHMRREPVQVARLQPGQQLYEWATQGLTLAPSEIWARRALFRLNNHPLLVCEAFLPTLCGISKG